MLSWIAASRQRRVHSPTTGLPCISSRIAGGMQAWRKEGLPVQPRPDEFEGPDYTGAGPGASN
jgi:hypothetical protein